MATPAPRRPTKTDSFDSLFIQSIQDSSADVPETPRKEGTYACTAPGASSSLTLTRTPDCAALPPPSSVVAWHCQVALAIIQALFCIGSVYLKSALISLDVAEARKFHPIIYAFVREAVAGPVMCAIAYGQSGELCAWQPRLVQYRADNSTAVMPMLL